MAAPSPDRQAAIACGVWELALATWHANGSPLLPDALWCLEAAALSAPATAACCPRVLAAVAPEVRAAVRELAQPVTRVAPEASQQAASGVSHGRPWLTTQEAARALRISAHGARAAARRGRVAGYRGPSGEWRIDRASVQEYRDRRTHARADS